MEKRLALGMVRGNDRIVSREKTDRYSLGDFKKFLWCGDPTPSITISGKSKCLCVILELDLSLRVHG